ncbi:hypothetical protein BD408DRAFT_343660, partial [Parasitella parasitica]
YKYGHGKVVDEHMEGGNIVGQNEFPVETIATHSNYLENVASSESLACPMLIDKPKDKDIRMKQASALNDI